MPQQPHENGELKAGASGNPTARTLARERVSNSAKIVHTGSADHGTRFFNVPDLTSSVKRRLSALTRRRFARSADRREAGPTRGTA